MKRVSVNRHLGVLQHEQRRLATVARWALLVLHTGHGDQALADLRAVAAVTALLLAGGDYTQEAQEATKSAAAALDSLQEGKGVATPLLGSPVSRWSRSSSRCWLCLRCGRCTRRRPG